MQQNWLWFVTGYGPQTQLPERQMPWATFDRIAADRMLAVNSAEVWDELAQLRRAPDFNWRVGHFGFIKPSSDGWVVQIKHRISGTVLTMPNGLRIPQDSVGLDWSIEDNGHAQSAFIQGPQGFSQPLWPWFRELVSVEDFFF